MKRDYDKHFRNAYSYAGKPHGDTEEGLKKWLWERVRLAHKLERDVEWLEWRLKNGDPVGKWVDAVLSTAIAEAKRPKGKGGPLYEVVERQSYELARMTARAALAIKHVDDLQEEVNELRQELEAGADEIRYRCTEHGPDSLSVSDEGEVVCFYCTRTPVARRVPPS